MDYGFIRGDIWINKVNRKKFIGEYLWVRGERIF